MLENGSHKAVNLTGCTEEYLTLTVLYVFLNIERHCLSDAEILHVLRYIDPHLGTKLEEVVYCMT